MIDLLQAWRNAIFFRQDRALYRPGDPDVRIVPEEGPFRLRCIKRGAFVGKEGGGTGNTEAMRETFRDIDLARVFP